MVPKKEQYHIIIVMMMTADLTGVVNRKKIMQSIIPSNTTNFIKGKL